MSPHLCSAITIPSNKSAMAAQGTPGADGAREGAWPKGQEPRPLAVSHAHTLRRLAATRGRPSAAADPGAWELRVPEIQPRVSKNPPEIPLRVPKPLHSVPQSGSLSSASFGAAEPRPVPYHAPDEKPFPHIQPKPALTQLRAVLPGPVSGHGMIEFAHLSHITWLSVASKKSIFGAHAHGFSL